MLVKGAQEYAHLSCVMMYKTIVVSVQHAGVGVKNTINENPIVQNTVKFTTQRRPFTSISNSKWDWTALCEQLSREDDVSVCFIPSSNTSAYQSYNVAHKTSFPISKAGPFDC